MVDTPSTASPALKMIYSTRSYNTSHTSYRKQCKKDGTNELVHDEGDDAVLSHQISTCLVQSRLSQEERQTTTVNILLMADPTPLTIGTKHTQITTGTSSKDNFDQ